MNLDKNQLGRRNLTPDQMSYLQGRIYERRKQKHGGQIPEKGSGQNDASLVGRTREALAKELGVGARNRIVDTPSQDRRQNDAGAGTQNEYLVKKEQVNQ